MKVILTMLALTVSLNPIAYAGEATKLFLQAAARTLKTEEAMTLKQNIREATLYADRLAKDPLRSQSIYRKNFFEDAESGLEIAVRSQLGEVPRRFIVLNLNDVSLGNRSKILDLVNKNRKWLENTQSKNAITLDTYEGQSSPHAILIEPVLTNGYMTKLSKLLVEIKETISPNSSKIILSRKAVAVSASK